VDYDTIIVGGGSAGCVLANRLSARSAHRVLLLEAGMDTPPGAEPKDVLDSYPIVAYFNPTYQWGDLRVTLESSPHNAPREAPIRRYEQARIMGGGSSINAQLANRGAPHDYDEWEALGAEGWGWAGVLPYFKKLETDLDFDGPLHGKDGPLPIRRLAREVWPGYARAAAAAYETAGFRYLPDQNGEWADGYFPIAMSNVDDHRVSAAMAYLDASVRARANLTILAHAPASEILFQGNQATGVRFTYDGKTETARAALVVLASGALHSPAFLLRSGIGPAAALQALGIAVRADRPGVGKNLNEHPSIGLSGFLGRAARLPDSMRRHLHVSLRYSSRFDGCPQGDMFLSTVGKSAWHPVGWRLGSILTWVNKTYSRGELRLASADPRVEPKVDFRLLDDRRDLERLMWGFKFVAGMLRAAPLQGVIGDLFPSSYSERVRSVGVVNFQNWLKTWIAGQMMDGPAPLRRWLIDNVLTEGVRLDRLLADDAALEDYVRRTATGTWHASGTCRMGRAGDRMAVTDGKGRVHGVDGLRVVDASLFPCVPCANTNIPTIMTAEKIADAIVAG